MTITETVAVAIATMPGNKPFRPKQIPLTALAHADGNYEKDGVTYLDGDQVSRALRNLRYVTRGYGKCIVKGRRVMP